MTWKKSTTFTLPSTNLYTDNVCSYTQYTIERKKTISWISIFFIYATKPPRKNNTKHVRSKKSFLLLVLCKKNYASRLPSSIHPPSFVRVLSLSHLLQKNTLVHKTMFLLLFSPILFSINSTISHPPRFIILLISIYIHIHAANTPTYCLTEYQNKMERQHREILFFTIILLRSTCILK